MFRPPSSLLKRYQYKILKSKIKFKFKLKFNQVTLKEKTNTQEKMSLQS